MLLVLGGAKPVFGANLILDHTNRDWYESNYATAASAVAGLNYFFAHASVGGNIIGGLRTLHSADAAKYPLTTQNDDDTPPETTSPGVFYEYNRRNPGWLNKITLFTQFVDNGWRNGKVKVAMNKFCYVDQTATWETYRDAMLDLEARYPNTIFVYWTMPLTTSVSSTSLDRHLFNKNLRDWIATQDGKVLFDIADLEAHDESNTEHTFVRDGVTCQRMYANWTTDGGHLDAVGREYMARCLYSLLGLIATGVSMDINTGGAENIGKNSVDVPSTVTIYTGGALSGRGVCVNTAGAPTTSDHCVAVAASAGTLTASFSGLQTGAQYYARAYAIRGGETRYGNQVSFSTTTGVGPIARAGDDRTVGPNATVTLSGAESSDPDGVVSAYAWVQTAGARVALLQANTATPTFTVSGAGALTFQLTVTDNDGNQDTDSVTVTAISGCPPVADAGPDRTVAPGETVRLNGMNSRDKDGRSLTFFWAQTSGPGVSLAGAGSARASFAPGQEGAYVFQLTVTDAHGLWDTDTVMINVVSDKTPPKADAGPDRVADVGERIVLSGASSSDKDGRIVSYTWEQIHGTALTLKAVGRAAVAFTPASEGAYAFALHVADNDGLLAMDVVRVNVTSGKIPPKAEAGPRRHVDENTLVQLNGGNSHDLDGVIESYDWEQTVGAPVELSDANVAAPTFTPQEQGVYCFRLVVTDNDGLTDTDCVMLTVSGTHKPPTAHAWKGSGDSTSSGGRLAGVSGASETVILDARNSVGESVHIVSYLWTQVGGPAVILENADGAQAWFTATESGAYTFELTVEDSIGLQDTDTLVVNVMLGEEKAPVADAGADQLATPGHAVTLDGSGSVDPGGSIVEYTWSQISGAPVTMTDVSTARSGFTTGAEGAYLFMLTVEDDSGLQDTDTVIVNISSGNTPPVADAGNDIGASPGDTGRLNGEGSYDPDGDVAEYAWEQVSGPAVLISSANTGQTDVVLSEAGEAVLQLTVTDDTGFMASDELTVGSSSLPAAPAAPPIAYAVGMFLLSLVGILFRKNRE